MTDNEILKQMITHIPLNTHLLPKTLLIVSDLDIKDEDLTYYDTKIVRANSIEEIEANSVDIAIVESIADIAKLSLVVKDSGLIAIPSGNIYDNVEANKTLISKLAKEFKIIQPSVFKDNQSFILASKKYHPTADMLLQRAEMLEMQPYYNADIHKASFVYDNLIESLYKGYIYK
jgi:spermidine synthase